MRRPPFEKATGMESLHRVKTQAKPDVRPVRIPSVHALIIRYSSVGRAGDL